MAVNKRHKSSNTPKANLKKEHETSKVRKRKKIKKNRKKISVSSKKYSDNSLPHCS
jgi:hypothetical protein